MVTESLQNSEIEMEIIEDPDAWWRFLVPIKSKSGERKERYLRRAKRCVLTFHKKYIDRRKPGFRGIRNSLLFRIYGTFGIDQLTEEGLDYKYFEIPRQHGAPSREYTVKFQRNVELFVEPPDELFGAHPEITAKNRVGIVSLVGSIIDNKTKERKDSLEFIKGIWRDFDYKCD